MSLFLSLLLAFGQAGNFGVPRLEQSASLAPPLNTIASSWVILDAEISAQGHARPVNTLHGANPFHGIALSNLSQWIFSPAIDPLPTVSRATIIFLFRPPDLFSATPLEVSPSVKRQADQPALPLLLSDPGYPVNSVGEGTVVLELQIAPTGAIQAVRVVRDAPGLAAHTEKTVRSWKFEPALRNGSAITGMVIVAASFLRPNLYSAPTIASPTPAPIQPPPSVFNDTASTPPAF